MLPLLGYNANLRVENACSDTGVTTKTRFFHASKLPRKLQSFNTPRGFPPNILTVKKEKRRRQETDWFAENRSLERIRKRKTWKFAQVQSFQAIWGGCIKFSLRNKLEMCINSSSVFYEIFNSRVYKIIWKI